MTLSESAINEILFALDNGGGADLVRQLAELWMQDLIEAEATEVIGAERWERTIDRIAHRNGHRPRVLSTKAGDLELRIPSSIEVRSSPRSSSLVAASIKRCMRW